MANETLTTGASRSMSNYNQDDVLNIARLAWDISGNAEFQKKQYGSDSIDMFGGNRAGMMKVVQDYLNGVTTRVPELDTALDKAVQQHFGSKVVAPATGDGGGQYVYGKDLLNKKANDAAVRTLYKSYFDRDPSSAELKNWGDSGGKDTTVKALEQFLQAERVKYGVATEVKPVPESKGGSGTVPTQQKDPTAKPVSVKFTDSEYYKSLSDDMKKLVNSAFNTITLGTEQQAKLFGESLQTAVNTADPYYKSVLALAMGEFNSQVAKLNGDYKTAVMAAEQTQKYLNEDLTTTRDELNLESQAKLAQLNREYQSNVLGLRDEAANRGVTFGTGRGTLQEGLATAQAGQQEVVQSVQRQQNFQLAELKRKADRGDEAAKMELDRLNTAKTTGMGTLARSAESQFGAGALANIPTLSGQQPLGQGIGSIEEAKRKDILAGTLQRFDFSKPVI